MLVNTIAAQKSVLKIFDAKSDGGLESAITLYDDLVDVGTDVDICWVLRTPN